MTKQKDDREQQWDEFLEAWPLEAIQKLTLEQYTTSADDRKGEDPDYPFTYWLESMTDDLGSIWGGSAFKFGIFRRKDKTPKESDGSRSYSNLYGWYSKFGSTPEEAFQNVKKHLLQVIENVQAGDLEAIDQSPLGDVLSWKVAFLYQDRSTPIVMPIYAARKLRDTHAAITSQTPMSQCHQILMAERGMQNIFQYADKVFPSEMSGDQNVSKVNKNSENGTNITWNKNTILYGPPGTGKTWISSEIAVRICDDEIPENREDLMERYRELVSEGRIAFTTFHQSMGYEEFVEGLRPETETEDGDGDGSSSAGFRLVSKPGIFRQICALAKESGTSAVGQSEFDLTGRQYFKMSLGRAHSQNHIFEAAIDQSRIAIGYGGEFDWSSAKFDNYEAIKAKWREFEPSASGNNPNIAQVYNFRGRMKKGDIVIISDGNFKFRAIGEITGDYEYNEDGVFNDDMIGEGQLYPHQRAVKWHRVLEESLPYDVIKDGQFSQMSCYYISPEKIKNQALTRYMTSGDPGEKFPKENYVLIIDEINRANISKVFGELITLLEPDKRLGAGPNALQVTLPYSRDKFGVPQNLYIVGTMNTADRSIALLDTALRRRFHFQEMMPLYDIAPVDRIVEGVHLRHFLKAINDRIEWLFDRDHQIGHSYLVKVETLVDLERVVRRKIIPLLTEYFYEDWEKVCIALNDKTHQFVLKEKLPAPALSDGTDEERFRFRVNPKPFSIEAFTSVYE